MCRTTNGVDLTEMGAGMGPPSRMTVQVWKAEEATLATEDGFTVLRLPLLATREPGCDNSGAEPTLFWKTKGLTLVGGGGEPRKIAGLLDGILIGLTTTRMIPEVELIPKFLAITPAVGRMPADAIAAELFMDEGPGEGAPCMRTSAPLGALRMI